MTWPWNIIFGNLPGPYLNQVATDFELILATVFTLLGPCLGNVGTMFVLD